MVSKNNSQKRVNRKNKLTRRRVSNSSSKKRTNKRNNTTSNSTNKSKKKNFKNRSRKITTNKTSKKRRKSKNRKNTKVNNVLMKGGDLSIIKRNFFIPNLENVIQNKINELNLQQTEINEKQIIQDLNQKKIYLDRDYLRFSDMLVEEVKLGKNIHFNNNDLDRIQFMSGPLAHAVELQQKLKIQKFVDLLSVSPDKKLNILKEKEGEKDKEAETGEEGETGEDILQYFNLKDTIEKEILTFLIIILLENQQCHQTKTTFNSNTGYVGNLNKILSQEYGNLSESDKKKILEEKLNVLKSVMTSEENNVKFTSPQRPDIIMSAVNFIYFLWDVSKDGKETYLRPEFNFKGLNSLKDQTYISSDDKIKILGEPSKLYDFKDGALLAFINTIADIYKKIKELTCMDSTLSIKKIIFKIKKIYFNLRLLVINLPEETEEAKKGMLHIIRN